MPLRGQFAEQIGGDNKELVRKTACPDQGLTRKIDMFAFPYMIFNSAAFLYLVKKS